MILSGLYAAVLALIYVAISIYVVRLRFRHKVGLGDGKVYPLKRWIRIHANFAEYVPFALLLLALLESMNENPAIIHGLGIALVVGRLSHLVGLSKSHNTSPGRFLGSFLTFGVLTLTAMRLLILQG